VLQYTFVTIDEKGNEVVVAQGEYEPDGNTYAVGDSVTVPGVDGVRSRGRSSAWFRSRTPA
jgi:hypothetical protein